MNTPDLAQLTDDWAQAMTAAGRSANTIATYTTSVREFLKYQAATGTGGFTLKGARGFIALIQDSGGSVNTAKARSQGLRAFSAWLRAEGHTTTAVLGRLEVPRPGKMIVPYLTDDKLNKLLAACAAGRSFWGCRDEALIAFMAYTGARSDEALQMDLPRDLHMEPGRESADIRNGKGNHQRRVALAGRSLPAMRQYLEARRARGRDDNGPLWISLRGGRLSYDGAAVSIGRRAGQAGIDDVTLHMLRRTFAVRWLRNGGTELGLKTAAGWTTNDMMAHYVSAASEEQSMDEARVLFA